MSDFTYSGRKTFDKSFKGLPYRRYRDMKRRVIGDPDDPKFGGKWSGLELIPKHEFVEWAHNDKEYFELFHLWVAADRNSQLTPSIHRPDENIGYIVGNMQWLTKAEHTKLSLTKANEAKRRKRDGNTST